MENKFKRATKRITAVAATAALVSSSVFGASLADYPQNFVSSGQFDGQVVIGNNADSAAATSIISDLQSELAGGNKIKITAKKSSAGGAVMSAVDDKKTLNYDEMLGDVAEELDDDDTLVLRDSDLDGDDYTQKLKLLNGDFDYRIFDEIDGETEIKTGLYYEAGTQFAEFTLDFEDVIDVSTSNAQTEVEGNTLEIMGNEFTVVEIADTSLTLVGGSNKISLGEGESTSVSVDGVSYELEIQSVSDEEVLLTINGETLSVEEGDVEDVAGISLAITDLVSSSRDSVKGYASIVVGGQKIEISGSDVKINDEDLNDIYEDYRVTADFGYMNGGNTDTNNFNGVRLTYEVDDNNLLEEGNVLEDVLFDSFILTFDGINVDSDDYSTLKLSSSKDEVLFSGMTDDGDELPTEFKLTASAEDANNDDTPDDAQIYLGTDKNRIYHSTSDLTFDVIDQETDAIVRGNNPAVAATSTITVAGTDIGGGEDPGSANIVVDGTNIAVDLATGGLTPAQIATAIASAIDGDAAFSAAAVTNVVTITHGTAGVNTGSVDTSALITAVYAATATDDLTLTATAFSGGSAPTSGVTFDLSPATTDVRGNMLYSWIKDDEYYVYELKSISRDSSTPIDSEVDFEDLLSGSSVNTVKPADVQGDLELNANVITDNTDGSFSVDITNLGSSEISLENFLIMDFSSVEEDNLVVSGDTSVLTFKYNQDDIDIDDTGFTTDTFNVEIQRQSATDVDEALKLSISSTNDFIDGDDLEDDSDYKVYVDHYGTKVMVDEDKWDDITIMVPSEEVHGSVSINFGGAAPEVSTFTIDANMASSKIGELESEGYTVTTESVTTAAVEMDITAPVMASEVSGMSDMVVVGGPAVNMVAAKLLGVAYPSYGSSSGLAAGEAVVRYFSNSNSVLVYGWDAAGTTAAANKLNSGGLSGTSVDVN